MLMNYNMFYCYQEMPSSVCFVTEWTLNPHYPLDFHSTALFIQLNTFPISILHINRANKLTESDTHVYEKHTLNPIHFVVCS